ncbi:hypothetical protein ACIRPT_37385 [Streptomyces sp. NPDC101227]|uniref:hypothetical protein n=1 Tax=Streptomyces sp. NPDC101227 TaxID=3366136 RepID=UPI0037FFF40B
MTTRRISPAKLVRTPAGSGAPKVVAEGALSALRPDPQMVTVTGIQPGFVVRGLGRGQLPVAD